MLEIETAVPLVTEQQGSMQATFLLCRQCQAMLAVSYRLQDRLIGALNATLSGDCSKLQEPTASSPKFLSPGEKVARWQTLWQPILIRGFPEQKEGPS